MSDEKFDVLPRLRDDVDDGRGWLGHGWGQAGMAAVIMSFLLFICRVPGAWQPIYKITARFIISPLCSSRTPRLLFRSEIPCRGYGQPARPTPSF